MTAGVDRNEIGILVPPPLWPLDPIAIATLLAVAGTAVTGVLVFAVSLTVLWPVLVGCAGCAAIGSIAFMVVCNVGGGWKSGDEIKARIHFLDGMADGKKTADALRELADREKISLAENDLEAICDAVNAVVCNKTGKSVKTKFLKDLRQASDNGIAGCDFVFCNCQREALPLLSAVLALIPNSGIAIKENNGKWMMVCVNPQAHLQATQKSDYFGKRLCAIFNSGDSTSSPKEYLQSLENESYGCHDLVLHYAENRLVVDLLSVARPKNHQPAPPRVRETPFSAASPSPAKGHGTVESGKGGCGEVKGPGEGSAPSSAVLPF
ncbi:MAG: hypothetical protein LBT98_04285 [Puniceicoccales bacterium]|nr:hypothetical protein [Puniceicoccales bacterium]